MSEFVLQELNQVYIKISYSDYITSYIFKLKYLHGIEQTHKPYQL